MTDIFRLDVSRRARRQVRELNEWWRRNRTAAPNAVRDELARVFRLISSHPRIGPPAPDVELPDVRRIHLSRIAHYLYYRVLGGHKTFRPKALAEQLQHLDAVNIGAAGTFVIRRPYERWMLTARHPHGIVSAR